MNAMEVKLKPKYLWNGWGVSMTIGVQGFSINAIYDNKQDVRPIIKSLKTALENSGCKVKVLK